jgi:hypothetical protein
MPDITILPANLATLVLESSLYGLLLLLFLSTVYFLATQRTLAGTTHSARHHLTSLVFMGVTALFLVVTVVGTESSSVFFFANNISEKHWSVVIYQASEAFLHLGTAATEAAFYGDLAQPSEVVKVILLFIATMLGDALVVRPGHFYHAKTPNSDWPPDISPVDNMGATSARCHIPDNGPAGACRYVV